MQDRKTILIVEDEPMIGLMLEDFLDSLGYSVAGIADGLITACRHARLGGFDAAILDVNLAGEMVWPAADILMEKNVPFLFVTGGSSEDVPQRFMSCPRLEKPFTMSTVEQALEQLFAIP
ncbi:MAG TPA: response regulator [Rhizorhapis sp.]|nr:response regulator [Rhizorhapis sp.]